MSRRKSVRDRFDEYVVPDGSGCWIWTAHVESKGYGQFRHEGRSLMAHRAFYEMLVGPIPAGATLDHLCRNKRCVNPEHLEPVTNRENILRGNNNAARNARQTHCKRGHPLSGPNLYVEPSGRRRRCRTCDRAHHLARREEDNFRRRERNAIRAGRLAAVQVR